MVGSDAREVNGLSMPELSDLISLAERVVKRAEASGAGEAECYVSWTRNIDTLIQGGLISVREGETVGVGVRAVIGKRVGFAAVSSMDEQKAFDTAVNAVNVARIRPEDPGFHHLPDPVKRPSRGGLFDQELLNISAGDLVERAQRILREAEGIDKRIVFVYGHGGLEVSEFAVANSRGINAGDSGAGMGGFIYCKAAERGEERTGSESISRRSIVDLTGVGETAAKRALESLGARRIGEPKKLPVLFDNYASDMFLVLLSYGVSARSVQEKRSALEGKLRDRVAPEKLTIVDDSWMRDGLNTSKYDAEGIPTTVKPVIEKGILMNYLYDSYAAHREDKISTGNAVRRGESYLQTPTVSPINWYVEPGSKTLEGLIAEIDEGLLVRYSLMGVGHSNFISGDFSVVATSPFYIKDGEIAYPLQPVTVAGNVYEALKDISEVGSDLRLSQIGKVPSILVSKLTCTGK